MKHAPLRLAGRGLAALSLAALGLAAPVGAQDFTVGSIVPIQTIPNVPLVGGKSTFVRVTTNVSGGVNPFIVDGLLRVYVNGVEESYSPIFSDNGPYQVPPVPNLNNENSTLNFVFLPPTANNVVLEVEINPAGPNFFPEANTGNNIQATAPFTFRDVRVPEMVYSPIDYRPSGGGPNLPDSNLIEPGVGDNFIQGIYPSPDWDYHRTDAPSKLWTSSLSGSGSSLNSSLTTDLNLMNPSPDYIYGWVPGSLPYNGQSIINGVASMGNTQNIRHQRTFAHEVGHCTGLFHNSVTVGINGADVERHLNLTESLPRIKATTARDIMVPGLLTNAAWIGSGNYNYFLNHPVWQPGQDELVVDQGPSVLITGVWNTATGAVEVVDMLEIPNGKRTSSVEGEAPQMLLTAHAAGESVRELAISPRSSTDCPECLGTKDEDGDGEVDADSATQVSPVVSFSAIVPTTLDGQAIERLVISQVGEQPVTTTEFVRSATAPEGAFLTPAGEPLEKGPVVVSWTVSDRDGDALLSYLRYSPDGERMVPIATGISETSWEVDMAQLPTLVDGQGFFEVLISDGLNTTVIRTAPQERSTVWAGVGGNPPWVEVLTPDNGFSYRKGATVLLHSSGWDLEDRVINGSKLTWESTVDGALGTGRLLAVSDLSVGAHEIRVTATDSGSLTSSDSATITIVDRDLPTTDFCQTDLGFGGPGNAVLTMCGGDLSTGTTADVSLVGAPASSLALFFIGGSSNPTFLEGGVLVPIPVALIEFFLTDTNGEIFLPGIQGGGGPLTVFLQAVIDDPSQVPYGYAFSNALQVEFLP